MQSAMLVASGKEHGSNVTDKSDLHSRKHCALKKVTESGTAKNLRPVFPNAPLSIISNFDIFSITTDFIILFSETL
jgi:hypothetical protein